MDIFDAKNIKPMLIANMKEPFDSPDWIYELKWDGIRCIMYLDDKETEIRNKRNKTLNTHVPELLRLHTKVKEKCILDGELIVYKSGAPDFYEIQRRVMTTNAAKIAINSKMYPATFVAYDILYLKGKEITDLPLTERKRLLAENTAFEDSQFAISKYFPSQGNILYQMAVTQKLEGVVAKKSDSKYYFDKRTKDWIKFKVMEDEDFVVCGYIIKDNHMTSLVLGQYNKEMQLIFKGHITLGISLNQLLAYPIHILERPPFDILPSGNVNAIWLAPRLVCVVQYMANDKGIRRQPVFKGFRNDIRPKDCREIQ